MKVLTLILVAWLWLAVLFTLITTTKNYMHYINDKKEYWLLFCVGWVGTACLIVLAHYATKIAIEAHYLP